MTPQNPERGPRSTSWLRRLDMTPQDARSLGWILLAVLPWKALTALVAKALATGSISGPASWALASLPAIAGLGLAVAFIRFLARTDELQRKIQLGALALGFGGALLTMNSYRLFEPLGAPQASIRTFELLMLAFYTLGALYGVWRYR